MPAKTKQTKQANKRNFSKAVSACRRCQRCGCLDAWAVLETGSLLWWSRGSDRSDQILKNMDGSPPRIIKGIKIKHRTRAISAERQRYVLLSFLFRIKNVQKCKLITPLKVKFFGPLSLFWLEFFSKMLKTSLKLKLRKY